MRQSIKLLAFAVIATLNLPALAQQAPDTGWMVRARAVNLAFDNGQSNLVSALDITAKSRWIPEVDISYFFSKNIAAELVLTYPQKIDIKSFGEKIGQVRALPPSLLVQYHFTDFGAFKPYVGAGINYTRFSKRNNILNGAASIDSSSFGLTGQIGMDYMINKNWSINLDVKYVKMNTDVHVNGLGKIGELDLDPMTYGIGVGYRF